ncbi:MAG: deoxyribonuclease V, partial [Pseudomonadota bacterium]
MKAPPGLASELIERQKQLADQVDTQDRLPSTIRWIAGVDAAFPKGGQITRASAVLMRFPEMELVEQAVVDRRTTLPYIPGLLSFRELPAILDALTRLSRTPDVVLCDGQGCAHPRRFGGACHLGVETGLATIGIGKSRLCGRHGMPGEAKGEQMPLMDGEEVIGAVLRTRRSVKPVYVSIGHRVNLERAVRVTLDSTSRFRLPE